jgi:alkylation response protein AidB-like acyl-CoA dehydrogenase
VLAELSEAIVNLSEELDAYATTMFAWAVDRIGPHAAALDREQRFSPTVWDELRRMELVSLPFPESVGGDGGSFLAYVLATEQVARVSAAAALYPGTTVQVAMTIQRHGTQPQRDRWLPVLLAGERPAAWAFTEPGTGSDPKQLQTTAVRDGDTWLLSGQKQFISFAAHAQLALVFARTEGSSVGAFVVDPGAPGWSVGPPVELLAFGGGEPAPVYLDQVRVAADALIGDPGTGFDVLLAGESQGKIRAAAICVGLAQRALDEAAAYALARTHRGEPIGRKFPTLQVLLGEMQASIHAARALTLDAAALVDQGRTVADVAAAARIVAGRAAREVTSAAMQIGGAYALTRDLPFERLYREGKFFEVAQGVVEIQKVIVGKHVLQEVGRGR